MRRSLYRKVAGFILILSSWILLINFSLISQDNSLVATESQKLQLLFYNVENLFDTENNPAINDDEFTPGGSRRWTNRRYYQKLNSLSKVIIAAGEWGPPDMIGLCEVENLRVVEDLIRRTPLRNFNLGVVCAESDDPRGITLAFIYNRDRLSVADVRNVVPGAEEAGEPFRSRPVLYLKLVAEDEPLHLFLNHWPSRRGGVLGGQAIRLLLAREILNEVERIREDEGDDSAVIIAGDFNCSPGDREMRLLTEAGFVNLAEEKAARGIGTYRFRGVWQMLDQILVSESMTIGDASFRAGSFHVIDHDFLLFDDPSFPGKKPFSTYQGFSYTGGYSDHLPVLLQLSQSGRHSRLQERVPMRKQAQAYTPWP